jgi:lipoate-protein ligase A
MNGYRQMAIDESILSSVSENLSNETIRFFDFEPAAVTVGRLQRVDPGLIDTCRINHIDLVRRLTGGRIVVHTEDFTFSFIVHASNPSFGGSVYQTYEAVSAPFLSALRRMGIPVEWRKAPLPDRQRNEGRAAKAELCFAATSRYEIVVHGQKILGISQYRRADTILVQGTLLLGKPLVLYKTLFGAQGATNGFSCIANAHQAPVNFAAMAKAISYDIKETYGISLREGVLSSIEAETATQLTEKYRAPKWIENRA